MVFAGQDAWRKHPLLSGCYRRPLPGLGTAIAIFGAYLCFDYITTPRAAPKHLNITFSENGDEGDTMPTAKISKHH